MSVRLSATQWNDAVPYTIDDAIDGDALDQLHRWIDSFNASFDQPVLIARDDQTDYVKYYRENSYSPVGNQHSGEQRVAYGNAARERTFRHETCHAIGMHHEFAHRGFPWRDIHRQSFVLCIPAPITSDNEATWRRLLALNKLDISAGGVLRQMRERDAEGAVIRYSSEIDWSSIMMVGGANIGNTVWSPEEPTRVEQRAVPNERLTATDIVAVKALLGRST